MASLYPSYPGYPPRGQPRRPQQQYPMPMPEPGYGMKRPTKIDPGDLGGYHTDEEAYTSYPGVADDYGMNPDPRGGPQRPDDYGMAPDRRPGGYRPVVDPVRPHTRPSVSFNPNTPADAYGDMSPDRPNRPRRSDTSGFGPPPPRPPQSFQPPRVQPSRGQAYGAPAPARAQRFY